MKKLMSIVVVLALAGSGMFIFSGCGQKEVPESAQGGNAEAAHKLLLDGTVLLKQGEVMKAVESFATSIKLAPDSTEAYFMLAETFIHLKQFPQAQSLLGAATKRFPNDPVVFYLLAVSYEGTNDLMPAIVSARKSVDLFQAKNDEIGQRRATVLLGVLVQIAKKQSEDKMVANAAKEAAATTAKP